MASPPLQQAAETVDGLPETPDFDFYPVSEAITAAKTDGAVVSLAWSDGVISRYHALWLRENAADPASINAATRESTYDLAAAPDDLTVASASVDATGGARWLQGCYGEREELQSRLRVLARNRRGQSMQ